MSLYSYQAIVESVHDGDTLTLLVDLGFDTYHLGAFRLLGCNARELSMPGGLEAQAHLASLLPPGTKVQARTVKPDKFGGRYDVALFLADGSSLASLLIAGNWAAPWSGQGTKPLPPWPRPSPLPTEKELKR